ncbi:LppU/SCO3897 family protein [Micromonospora fluostatini]|uniref:LppU/SCO3897 family protein n=1 Tax=Micromonospora sp. JCM 30529 TaxID=3421643 RepID=UPI003D173537
MPYQSGDPGPEPGPPRRHRSRGPLIAVAVIFTALVVGGVSTLFLLRQRAEEASVATATEAPPSPAPPTGTPEPGGAAPESSADPRFVKVGQCVRNDGPLGGQPKLAITECGPKTYEVLRRFDGATSGEKDAEAKCARVEGYTNWYFFDSELDTLDFVLCLKLR